MTASAPTTEVDLVALATKGSEEWSRTVLIIGRDFHALYQRIVMVGKETGEPVSELRAGGRPLNP
jgi:hypothetical protein